mmetsp:Transcript_30997/g.92897  ORF Transcript_30997/g.92897 Transcript_30997/m.92897 type:complete len:331 (-) Transcript_30997:3284-4276(-)
MIQRRVGSLLLRLLGLLVAGVPRLLGPGGQAGLGQIIVPVKVLLVVGGDGGIAVGSVSGGGGRGASLFTAELAPEGGLAALEATTALALGLPGLLVGLARLVLGFLLRGILALALLAFLVLSLVAPLGVTVIFAFAGAVGLVVRKHEKRVIVVSIDVALEVVAVPIAQIAPLARYDGGGLTRKFEPILIQSLTLTLGRIYRFGRVAVLVPGVRPLLEAELPALIGRGRGIRGRMLLALRLVLLPWGRRELRLFRRGGAHGCGDPSRNSSGRSRCSSGTFTGTAQLGAAVEATSLLQYALRLTLSLLLLFVGRVAVSVVWSLALGWMLLIA